MCIGMREHGKTTFAYSLAHQKPTRVILDPKNSFYTSPIRRQNADDLYNLLNEQEEIIISPDVQPGPPEVFAQTCDELMEWVRNNPEEPFAFLVDESRDVDLSSEIPTSFDWLIRKTPRKMSFIIMTVHRPVEDIPPSIRGIGDRYCFFRVSEPADLDSIRRRVGDEATEVIKNLGPYEFVHWNANTGEWQKMSNADEWFVDLHKLQTKTREEILV